VSRDTHTHTYPTRANVPEADEFLESRDTHINTYPTRDNVSEADEFLESRDTHTHTYPTRDNVPEADEFLVSRDTRTTRTPLVIMSLKRTIFSSHGTHTLLVTYSFHKLFISADLRCYKSNKIMYC